MGANKGDELLYWTSRVGSSEAERGLTVNLPNHRQLGHCMHCTKQKLRGSFYLDCGDCCSQLPRYEPMFLFPSSSAKSKADIRVQL